MSGPNLSAFLTNMAAIQAIAGTRIYPDKSPQHVYDEDAASQPYAVYQRSNVESQVLFCGIDDLQRFTMQIDTYAADYDNAEALANAIRDALLPKNAAGIRVGYAGPMGGVTVQTIQPDTESVPGPDAEPGLFRVSQSFNIWCREATS
jgi:hypothetical protein